MPYLRRNLIEPGLGRSSHCISRCVRRAWLRGIDSYSGKSLEHRKPIFKARIQQLGEIFATGIHTYAGHEQSFARRAQHCTEPRSPMVGSRIRSALAGALSA